jgi:PilZ domain
MPPEKCLEQREHPRYFIRAPADFEWIDEGVVRRGQGHTRDISSKGMFINSDTEPPAKADIRVEVSLHSVAEAGTNLRLSAKALVIRVEPFSSAGANHGFAIINTSYKLLNGETSLEDWETGLGIEPN